VRVARDQLFLGRFKKPVRSHFTHPQRQGRPWINETCRSNSHQLRVAPRGPAYPTRPHLRYRPLGYPSSPIEKHWHFVLPPARYLCRQGMNQSLVQYTIAPSSLTHRAPLNAFSFYIEQAKLRGGKVLPIVFVFVFLAFPFLPRSPTIHLSFLVSVPFVLVPSVSGVEYIASVNILYIVHVH
jgi:hypothetical protein